LPLGNGPRIWIGVDNRIVYFCEFQTALGISTVEAFKAWLAAEYAAGHPVKVRCQRALPLSYPQPPITVPYYPTTILEQDGPVKGAITASAKVMEV